MRARARVSAIACVAAAKIATADDATIDTQAPLPEESYVRLEPSRTFAASGSDSSDLLVRAVLAYRGLLVPDAVSKYAVTGVRIDVPFEHVDGARAIELGRIGLLVITGPHDGRNAIGVGVAADLPTATNAAFGDDTLQVGPAAFVQLAVARVSAGVLVRELLSSSSSRSVTKLEPDVTIRLSENYSLSYGGEIWIAGRSGLTTVPVNAQLGRSFGRHVAVAIGPEIVVAGADRGDVRLFAQLDVIAP